jgi:hypothetical protein
MSKVAIEGNALGSGTFTIASPNTNSSYTLSLPENTGTILTNATAGTVLQVVSVTKSDTFSTASTSLTDITGMSVSITPTSASSKILVFYSLGEVIGDALCISGTALLRGSTKIGSGASAGSRNLVSTGQIDDANIGGPQSFMFLDSPATTSSTTYKLQIYTHTGIIYINRSSADTDSAVYNRAASTITAMEIAA